MFRRPPPDPAYLGLVRETAAIAAAHGVPVDDYTNFPIRTYVTRPDEETVAALSQRAFLAPAATGGVESFASMTQDLRAGRAIEVDDVFADLVERGERAGVAVPRLRLVPRLPARPRSRPPAELTPEGSVPTPPAGRSSGTPASSTGPARPRARASTWCWKAARSPPRPVGGDRTAAGEGEVVDLQGRTLMPGLIDCHVHLTFSGEPQEVERAATVPVPDLAWTAAASARDTLDGGVTTVRDVGARDGVAIRLREAIAGGPRARPANAGGRRDHLHDGQAMAGSSAGRPTGPTRCAARCASSSRPAPTASSSRPPAAA